MAFIHIKCLWNITQWWRKVVFHETAALYWIKAVLTVLFVCSRIFSILYLGIVYILLNFQCNVNKKYIE